MSEPSNTVKLPDSVQIPLKAWGPVILAILGAVGVSSAATPKYPENAPTKAEFEALATTVDGLAKAIDRGVERDERLYELVIDVIKEQK